VGRLLERNDEDPSEAMRLGYGPSSLGTRPINSHESITHRVLLT
jgi:hypothetical protein